MKETRALSGGSVGYYQKGTTYTVFLSDGTAYDFASRWTNLEKSFAQVADKGVLSLLSSVRTTGGDPILLRALEAGNKTNVAALIADIEVAKSYRLSGRPLPARVLPTYHEARLN